MELLTMEYLGCDILPLQLTQDIKGQLYLPGKHKNKNSYSNQEFNTHSMCITRSCKIIL